MSLEEQLRTGLRDWADDVDVSGGPDLRADSLAGLARRRAVRRASLVAAAVAVALVVVGVPLGLSWLRGPDDVRPAGPTATGSLFDLPTRGSLAGDARFVEGVRALPWIPAWAAEVSGGAQGFPDPPVDARHVVFAGTLPSGNLWALVAGPNVVPVPSDGVSPGADQATALVWFAGPPGAAADEMAMAGEPRGVRSDQPLTALDVSTGDLLALASPGDEVQVSPGPTVRADGEAVRTWQRMTDDGGDGAAVVRLAPEDLGVGRRAVDETLPAVRIVRDGEPRAVALSDGLIAGEPAARAPLDLRSLRGTPVAWTGSGEHVWDALLAAVDQPLTGNRYLAHWAGVLPSPGGRRADATLLSATVPSGAVVFAAGWTIDLGYGSYALGDCATGTLPAGGPAGSRTFAVRCAVDSITEMEPDAGEPLASLLVVAPADAVRARVLGSDGRVLADRPLDDGVLVTPWVDGTVEVETVRADGATQRAPVSG